MEATETQAAEATVEAVAVATEGVDAPPLHDPLVEETAKAAYARAAEELKWKGDFPAWDVISDRARALYIESAAHVTSGNPPRTRYEEIVAEVLQG